jgi:hypothetical protein
MQEPQVAKKKKLRGREIATIINCVVDIDWGREWGRRAVISSDGREQRLPLIIAQLLPPPIT